MCLRVLLGRKCLNKVGPTMNERLKRRGEGQAVQASGDPRIVFEDFPKCCLQKW